MASLPLPASLNLRDRDAVESRSPKRHRALEPPRPRPEDSGSHREPSPPPSLRRRAGGTPPPAKVRRRSRSPSPSPSKVRRQSRSPPYKVRRRSRSPPPPKFRRRSRSPPRSPAPSKSRCRSRSPPPSNVRRRSRSPPPSKPGRRSRSPLPYKVRRRSRSPPPYKARRRSRSLERRHAKRPSTEAAVERERARPSSLDESLVENRPSHSHRNCKYPETSSAAGEKRPDPAIRGDEQKLDCEKMDRKNQSDDKAPSRNARRKKMRRQAKKEMGEAPSGNGSRKKIKRHIWAEAKKEFREMKKDKLLENIKKLQSCVWLLEKDGADMAEIMEFRSMLESTKKQYVENEAQLAKEGSSAPIQVLVRDRLEKTVGT